jgi:hypothetical protein
VSIGNKPIVDERFAEGLGGVVTMLIPVLLVAGSRKAFRD